MRGTDVELKEKGLILKYRRKGGKYGAREVLDTAVVRALVEYLHASDRMNVSESDRPLWPGTTARDVPVPHSPHTRSSRI